jgi:hypothetical protein
MFSPVSILKVTTRARTIAPTARISTRTSAVWGWAFPGEEVPHIREKSTYPHLKQVVSRGRINLIVYADRAINTKLTLAPGCIDEMNRRRMDVKVGLQDARGRQ